MNENFTEMELPPKSTKLDEANLPNSFLKLFKRLRNISLFHASFEMGETIGDVLALSIDDLAQLPGVGRQYQQTLKELKARYREHRDDKKPPQIAIRQAVNSNEMRLYYLGLSQEEIKVLAKIERAGLSLDINSLLEIDATQLNATVGLGNKSISTFISTKAKIKEEINKIARGEIDLYRWESHILVPLKAKSLSIDELGRLLLEDIDRFIDDLSDFEQDIVQKRWGFVEEKAILEELGKQHNLTRERIRQIVKKLSERLVRSLRLSQESIWEVLEPSLSLDVPSQMPDLFACFNRASDFYEMLGMICGKENLEGYVNPPVKLTILDSYFAENGGPCRHQEIVQYLATCEIEAVKNAASVIRYLERAHRIRIDGERIWPLNLKKADAAAFVLASHPNGLPWADVAKHMNALNCCASVMPEDRLVHNAFSDPENIFLAGKGIYKHTRFVDFESIDIELIFDELLKYLDENSRYAFHLSECYRTSGSLQLHDYYVVRYIVKNYGEEYGFYFDGQSSSDSVGLERGFKRTTQKDVILEAMKSSAMPLTKMQVAELLKSKSANHAYFYLEKLIESGDVVQVDRMLYTRPEQAYKSISLSDYVIAIEELLISEGKPVEPSVFEIRLNEKMSVNYSKFFYASIATFSSKNRGWFRKHSLFSIFDIPYKNLNEAIKAHCQPDWNQQKNIDELQKYVSITRDYALAALNRWKLELSKGFDGVDL